MFKIQSFANAWFGFARFAGTGGWDSRSNSFILVSSGAEAGALPNYYGGCFRSTQTLCCGIRGQAESSQSQGLEKYSKFATTRLKSISYIILRPKTVKPSQAIFKKSQAMKTSSKSDRRSGLLAGLESALFRSDAGGIIETPHHRKTSSLLATGKNTLSSTFDDL
jgi:hypothetical protein